MEDYKTIKEDKLNKEIENAIKNRQLDIALLKAEDFLRFAYGKNTFDFWALRDFYREYVLGGKAQTRFDNNVEEIFKLRQLRVEPVSYTPKYESPYLTSNENKEKFDDLYEEFLKRTTKRKCMISFLRFIEGKLDEMFE